MLFGSSHSGLDAPRPKDRPFEPHVLYQAKESLQGESSSLCWLTKGKELCQGITILTKLYCWIHINIQTTCYGPYGHRQVGYSIGGKTHMIWYSKNISVISSPTYTTLIFVLYHIILCSFSSVTVSNMTMATSAETCS